MGSPLNRNYRNAQRLCILSNTNQKQRALLNNDVNLPPNPPFWAGLIHSRRRKFTSPFFRLKYFQRSTRKKAYSFSLVRMNQPCPFWGTFGLSKSLTCGGFRGRSRKVTTHRFILGFSNAGFNNSDRGCQQKHPRF